MLKLLYKTLLVTTLSVSLLLLDFSYKGLGLNLVQAQVQTNNSGQKKEEPDLAKNVTNSVGSSVSEIARTEKIDDKDLVGTLTMLVIGVLTQRLYKYKLTTDILLAAAAGTIFVAGEILAFIKMKDAMKGMEMEINRDKEGKINDEQVASLERLKRSYQDAKKMAGTKKNLQIAAAAAFVAAGVAAYGLIAVDAAALASCTGGITASLAFVKPLLASCAGFLVGASACATQVFTCEGSITAIKTALTGYELSRLAIAPSLIAKANTTSTGAVLLAAFNASKPACVGIPAPMLTGAALCHPLLAINAANASAGPGFAIAALLKNLPNVTEGQIANVVEKYTPSSDSMIMKIADFFFPQAKAGIFSPMGIASAAAVAFLIATSATLGTTIDFNMSIPVRRAIVWGVLAALTGAATTSTNAVIEKIDSNIAKIDAIINSMNTLEKGVATENTKEDDKTEDDRIVGRKGKESFIKPMSYKGANPVDYEDIDLSNGGNRALPCGRGEDGKQCKPFEDGLDKIPSFNSLNPGSQIQFKDIMKTASGLSGTSKISGDTLRGIGKLAGQSNALQSALNKAKADAAAKLKKAGSNFNLDSQTKKLSEQMEKGVKDNLKKHNTNAAGMLASFSGGKFGGGSDSTNSSASANGNGTTDKKAETGAGANAGFDANSINLNAGTSDTMDLGLGGAGDGTDGKMSAEELAAYNAAAAAANNGEATMDAYEIKNDISKDSDSNIFELISHRYRQSAYPRLFKLKDLETAGPAKKE